MRFTVFSIKTALYWIYEVPHNYGLNVLSGEIRLQLTEISKLFDYSFVLEEFVNFEKSRIFPYSILYILLFFVTQYNWRILLYICSDSDSKKMKLRAKKGYNELILQMRLFVEFLTIVQNTLCFAEAAKPNLLGHFPLYLKSVSFCEYFLSKRACLLITTIWNIKYFLGGDRMVYKKHQHSILRI